jgi:parvulin-like peptidyl-prolyl isomerase
MKKTILIVVSAVIIIIAGFIIWLYSGQLSPARANVLRKVSLPVALVGTEAVSGKEFYQRWDMAAELFSKEKDFNVQETQGLVLDQLVEEAKLNHLAKQRGVDVTQDELNTEYNGLVRQLAGGDNAKFEEMLRTNYKISSNEFKNKVLRAETLRSKLMLWHNQQESLNQESYDKRKELMDQLNQGKSFDEVVAVYTQDEATKSFAGDTGFIALSEFLPEFQEGIKNAKPGDQLQITSRMGLHIVKVLEIDRSSEDAKFHLQQIYIKPADFEKWYGEQAAQVSARRLIKI